MRSKPTRTACAIVALLLMATLAGCAKKEASTGGGTANKQVSRGDLIVGLTADGTVALPVTNLSFEVEGTVKAVHVSAGDTVQKGDVLAELDDTDVQLGIETAKNQLAKAESNYADALWSYTYGLDSTAQNLQNSKNSLNEKFDSFDYDNAVTEAKKTLEKRKSELAEAEAKAKNPYDSLASDRQLADAEALVKTRTTELSDAQANNRNPFSSTSYDRQIADAKAEVKEKEDRVYELLWSDDTAGYEAAQKALETAQTKLKRLQEDMATAKDQATKDAKAKLETAQKNLENAQQALRRLKEDIALAKTDAQTKADDTLKTARENLAAAQTALTKAEKNLEKAKKDFTDSLKKNTASYELQLESYNKDKKGSTAVNNAATAVKDAELALQEAENKLQKVQIISPIDGQIISVTKKEGEKVNASSNTGFMGLGTAGSGNAVVTVCDPSEIYLTANITEGDIVGIEAGQEVRVQIDSIGDQKFGGKVLSISSLPTTDSAGITSYAVTIRLDEANPVIRDGMAALLTFVRLEHTSVLMIPNKAVFIEEGRQYVNVLQKNGGYEKREVQCGLTNGTETEVLSGLEEGDTVAVGQVKG